MSRPPLGAKRDKDSNSLLMMNGGGFIASKGSGLRFVRFSIATKSRIAQIRKPDLLEMIDEIFDWAYDARKSKPVIECQAFSIRTGESPGIKPIHSMEDVL
jgi:hypothetical protein